MENFRDIGIYDKLQMNDGKKFITAPTYSSSSNSNSNNIIGENSSGLTTDIGTNAKLYNSDLDIKPPTYNKGVNTWQSKFLNGQQAYNKKYNEKYGVIYPKQFTLSGEFMDDGPLASNSYLHKMNK